MEKADVSKVADTMAAIAQLGWPVAFVIVLATVLVLFRRELRGLVTKQTELGIEIMGTKFTVKPAVVDRKPDGTASLLPAVHENLPLPADYFYLNHTSFLRREKQDEFQTRTRVFGVPHYDIRVILDSYYEGALDRVLYVLYLLAEQYPEPVVARSRKENKFLLKDLANGEYVLQAKVFLKDQDNPIVLQRYITLSEAGPRLPV
jgi:hypothetical protein